MDGGKGGSDGRRKGSRFRRTQRLAGVASVGVLSAWSSTDGRGSPSGGGLIA